MKKILVFVVALALLLPTFAFAAAEFSLGGYIKLDTFWDSTQESVFILPGARDNAGTLTGDNFNHGRLMFRSQESRFNFTIKGPKVFGATLTGFIEMDFDGTGFDTPQSTSNSYSPRLRHAMFRLNWPETELLLGQYWSLLGQWWVETAEDGPFMATMDPLARLPQIRVTQKFAGDWMVAGLVGLPNAALLTQSNPFSGVANNGSAAETPQIQGQVRYEHDWWGKAAYYGHPIPFTVDISAGWQRSINRFATDRTLRTFGQDEYLNVAGNTIKQQYVNPWMVKGVLFIPVIPTHTANLAGTASVWTTWWIGQGVEAFGVLSGASNLYRFQGVDPTTGENLFDVKLLKRFGGGVQAQYYFTNDWFVNVAYGLTKNYGVKTSTTNIADQDFILGGTDQFKWFQQIDATLWYRPIQALKFGLQYSYAQTKYFQNVADGNGNPNFSDTGHAHRVEFVGYFFF